MRWAAAMLVFGEHILEQYLIPHFVVPQPVESATWHFLKYSGTWGVTFFFMLSGFVLTWSARPTDTRRAFWRRRLAKIYPNHLVTMVLAAALALYLGLSVTPAQVLAHLTLTQVWQPDTSVSFALNGLSWSLCAELFFYLSFPFILPYLRRLGVTQLRVAMLVLPAVVIGYNVAFMFMTDRACMDWLTYFLPLGRVFEFALGMVLARVVQAGAWRGPGLRVATVVVVAAMAVAPMLPYPLGKGPAVIVPMMLLLPAAALADVAGARTLWSRPLVVYLGEVSFAFYMVHLLVIRTFRAFGLVPEVVHLGWAVGGPVLLFAVSLIAAVALHHGVERPMMRVLTRRRMARPAARHAGARQARIRPDVALSAMGAAVLAAAPVAFVVCTAHL
jgi:peptidoglycan/LPS O-acetylase OafA/YrhL